MHKPNWVIILINIHFILSVYIIIDQVDKLPKV